MALPLLVCLSHYLSRMAQTETSDYARWGLAGQLSMMNMDD